MLMNLISAENRPSFDGLHFCVCHLHCRCEYADDPYIENLYSPSKHGRTINSTNQNTNTNQIKTKLNFSTAWWTMQLISGEKDWKHVSVQKVVTLNICCNIAWLTFHLPHITTGSFQSHQRLEECNIPAVWWKSCAFYKVVRWHFSGVVGNGVTVCFLLRWCK